MGKKRISATIDPETDNLLERILKNGNYRNKSHVIEEAIKSFSELKRDKK